MKKTESECVNCGLPCLREACPNFSVTRYYCDKCGAEETLYKHDDKELCKDCLAEEFEVVEGSN
jgi:NADH pyrophosphatase NudC (nudix superfamily)